MRILKNNWPVVIAIAVLWATIFVLLRMSLAQNQGHFVYALDDGYIEIAIAKNFSQFRVWGVTKYGFTSATSSISWPLLLAGIYFVFGFHQITSFILNILCATGVVIAAHFILRGFALPSAYRFLLLIAVIFLTPLPTLVFAGMEHPAHILLHVMFAFVAGAVLAREEFAWRDRDSLVLLGLAALLTSVRYEALFVVGVVCVLLLLRRRAAYGLAVALAGLLPVGVYGFISVRHGAFWLPNSVLIKGIAPIRSVSGLLDHTQHRLFAASHLVFLMILTLAALLPGRRRGSNRWNPDLCLLIIFLGSTILHFVFGGIGWFYRYEAYLVALGVLLSGKLLWQAIALLLKFEGQHRLRLSVTACVLLGITVPTAVVLVQRGAKALRETAQGTTNVYQQQYQMARFLRDYYPGETIVANDIGVIDVLADIKLVDVGGLASVEMAKSWMTNTYSGTKAYEMGRENNAGIAVLYDLYLDQSGGASPHWTWLGEWQIQNNVTCASDRVDFYAVNSAEVERLNQNLEAFGARLPPGVKQKGCRDFPKYDLGTRVNLQISEADKYLCRGWSDHEAGIRWSDKKRAYFVFSLDEIKPSTLGIQLAPFLAPGKLQGQRVKFSLNDQPIGGFVLSGPQKLTLALAPTALRQKNVLTLELPDATSPTSLGMSQDMRLLGVNAEWIEITPNIDRR